MERQKVISVLLYPDSELVNHAVKRANLTRLEWEVIQLREYDSLTIEASAELLGVSSGTIKNRYKNGMRKLQLCWDSLAWVKSLV